MGPAVSSLVAKRTTCLLRLSLPFTIGFAVFATGCGGAGHSGMGTGPIAGETTTVVLLASSTANDQLQEFSITMTGLTLADAQGKSVPLLTSKSGYDYMHVNGNVEPLVTVTVPQGVYTSANATVELPLPACTGQTPGTLLSDEALNGPGSQGATVDLPAPITVDGDAMGLVLNLQVSQSAPFDGGCSQSLTNAVPVAPVFELTQLAIAAQPTNGTNGKAVGMRGLVTAVNASATGFSATGLYSINAGFPPQWQVTVNGGTVFQGISGVSQLAEGLPVQMDIALQADGSLLATRVEVLDANPSSLSVAYGPPIAEYPAGAYQSPYPSMNVFEVGQDGDLSEMVGLYSFSGTQFQVSGQLSNLQNLPFAATFNEANLVNGQNVFFTTHQTIMNAGVNGIQALSTVTLLPQTIDGTVSAISTEGAFTAYTVTLAPYDLFPNLAVEPGQATLLTDANTVTVYADSNTQMLGAPAVGGVFRFYGLVFDDNGTLKMDCAQVNDGVAE
jgi:hypothetical protein